MIRKSNYSNYRGISITNTMSKLYDRILRYFINAEYQKNKEEE